MLCILTQESEKGGGGTQLKTDGQTIEHLETLAKITNMKMFWKWGHQRGKLQVT